MANGQKSIDHVVVLMLENRSFDHMFGLYPDKRVEGLLTAQGGIDPVNKNSVTGQKTDFPITAGAAYTVPPEQIDRKGFGGPKHSLPETSRQLYGTTAPGASPGMAKMSGFAQSYYNNLVHDVYVHAPTPAQIGVPMTAFAPGQLPVLWQLAQEFCLCDHWFAEVPGPTQPNRLFAHAGTSAGFTHNVYKRNFDNPTIYEALQKAGHDWNLYYFDDRDSDWFGAIRKSPYVLQFDEFAAKARGGGLASYSFICPRYDNAKGAGGAQANSEHAPYDVRNGENLIADVYEALRAGPLWARTLLIVTYDEHGGYFDHVEPDTGITPPDSLTSPTADDKAQAAKSPKANGYLTKPDYQFTFNRMGLRVPAVLISPWIPKGEVLPTKLQHTSIMATLHELFGIEIYGARAASATSFASVLSLDSARTDTPEKLNRPTTLAEPAPAGMAEPITPQEDDMWPAIRHLDGHPDSGKAVPKPADPAQAAHYRLQRQAAHNAFHRARRRKAEYRISHSGAGTYEWTLHDETGKPVARSPQQYTTQAAAEAHVARTRDLAAFARQTTGSPAKASGKPKRKSKKGS